MGSSKTRRKWNIQINRRLKDILAMAGIEKHISFHISRHTFAKQWIINGGNVVSLSKLLGHSSLDITQNYINLLVSDVAKKVDEFNVLDKFYGKKRIGMRGKS